MTVRDMGVKLENLLPSVGGFPQMAKARKAAEGPPDPVRADEVGEPFPHPVSQRPEPDDERPLPLRRAKRPQVGPEAPPDDDR